MTTTVAPDDFVRIDSWQRLAAELGLPYRHTEHAHELFGQEVALVSGHCDYTVSVQADRHPNGDIPVLAAMSDWAGPAQQRDGYSQVVIGPACVPERCRTGHRYSLRTDRYTWQTFDEPRLRRWYVTNLDCVHPRWELLPFGINNEGDDKSARLLSGLQGRPKRGLLYVNFQPNTWDRVRLKERYRGADWATYRDEPNVPVGDYLAELADHRYALCPPGCGVDCYRLWECLYLGVVPVLHDNLFSRRLAAWGLPVAVVNNPFALNPAFLESSYEAVRRSADLSRARLSFWRELLRKEVVG